MRHLFQRNMVRFGLALAAVYASLVICTIEQHFQVVASEPSTYLLPFHHRCGLLLVASILWALLEAVWFFSGRSAPVSSPLHSRTRR